jgi:NADPH-dependent curcumin reductase CurA
VTDFARQIVLAELPTDRLSTAHFRMEAVERPSPGPGEVLLQVLYVTLDASNRAWMQGATYAAALRAGQVMYGRALAEVVESRVEGYAPGDLVWAETGWRDWAAMPARLVQRRARTEPLTYILSVYGITGLTAYHGLLDLGRPEPGETVVVSAAAGAVGTLAGQIAKLAGARTVGIAGGPEKCAWIKDALGYDAAIDYKAADARRALRDVCPNGVDVYFDNVGGEVFEAALFNMANHGRIVCCGSVSQYDGPGQAPGPRGVPGLIVTKRLTLAGFIVTDFADRREAALAQLRDWVESGKLKVVEDVIDGLESLPAALVGLLAGENRGKRMVKVA